MINSPNIIEAVERKRLFGLVCFFITTGIVLSIWNPPIQAPILILVYGLFFIFLRFSARLHHKRSRQPKSEFPTLPARWPKVSILVPAHNEESVIAKTIKTLLQLNYRNYEVLVIDDRSSDGTAKVIRELQGALGNRFSFFTRDDNDTPGKAGVLNDALQHTQGEILCILDADAFVEPDFLTRLIPYFSEVSVGAVQARKTLLNPHQNWLTLCQQYEYSLDAYFQTRRDTIHGAVELRGNGMLIRREALEALNYWNEHSLTEDLDFCTRMHIAGWDVRYVPTVQVWEEGLPNLIPLLHQRLRWTEGSLIRYLENAGQLLPNSTVPFRTKLDMMQFIFEFLAPVWLLTENMLLAFKWTTGQLPITPVLFSSSALLVLSTYFLWATYQGIYRYNQVSILQALKGTIMTYLYLSLLWLPIVFILLIRILFQNERNLKWEKTAHYGVVLE